MGEGSQESFATRVVSVTLEVRRSQQSLVMWERERQRRIKAEKKFWESSKGCEVCEFTGRSEDFLASVGRKIRNLERMSFGPSSIGALWCSFSPQIATWIARIKPRLAPMGLFVIWGRPLRPGGFAFAIKTMRKLIPWDQTSVLCWE